MEEWKRLSPWLTAVWTIGDPMPERAQQGKRDMEVWVSLFTGLDYWTGLLDSKFNHKISFPAHSQPPKAIVSPHLKQCPSLGHQDIYLVQCNL